MNGVPVAVQELRDQRKPRREAGDAILQGEVRHWGEHDAARRSGVGEHHGLVTVEDLLYRVWPLNGDV